MFLSAILAALIPALIPAGVDIVKGVTNKWLGGEQSKPSNFGEYIQAKQADTEQLKVLATLDTVGQTAQWVNNVRSLMRPAIGLAVLGAWVTLLIQTGAIPESVDALASSVIFYLFGDRTYMYMKRASR